MHIFKVAFYVSGAVYALFFEQGLLIPFFAVVVIYLLAGKFLNGGKDISTRKKIMLATWSDPAEGVITVKVPVRAEKANGMIAKAGKETRLTLTHFAIKAVGELLKTQPELNGKLVFGRVSLLLFSGCLMRRSILVVWLISREGRIWLLSVLKELIRCRLRILQVSLRKKLRG